jgi:ribonuclease HI
MVLVVERMVQHP